MKSQIRQRALLEGRSRSDGDWVNPSATLTEAVVREALDAAGMLTPGVERMAADVLSPDGLPRFIWTDDQPDPTTYTLMLLRAVAERQRWRAQYDQAKAAARAVDNHSATGTGPPDLATAHSSASPDDPPKAGPQERQSRVSAANPQDTSAASALMRA